MANTNLDLSIIILSHNTKRMTKQCIESIYSSWKKNPLAKKVPFEIILIDNGSTDGSIDVFRQLEKKHLNLRLILNTKNIGFGQANNQGVSLAKGSYILFLNSDTIILKDALYQLFMYYRKRESTIHFLGPCLFNKDLSIQHSAAPFYSLPTVFAALFLRGDYWGITRFSPRKTQAVDWISGACILTKKEYVHKLQGFDANVFMYMEEVDLLYRARKLGMKTYFYPKAKVIHIGSGSSKQRTYPILQVYRGLIYFYKKHYSILSLLILRGMLTGKAGFAWFIGYILNNNYLKNTYAQAFKLARQ